MAEKEFRRPYYTEQELQDSGAAVFLRLFAAVVCVISYATYGLATGDWILEALVTIRKISP